MKVIIDHTGANREVFEYGVSHPLPVKPLRAISYRAAARSTFMRICSP